MKNHYIYFIKENKNHQKDRCSCKIGVSVKPESRLSEMQVGNPRPLELAAMVGPFSKEQAYSTEKKFHRIFKPFHVRGEWFCSSILFKMHMIKDDDDWHTERRRIAKKDRKEIKRERRK
jgi:hypothetical protein